MVMLVVAVFDGKVEKVVYALFYVHLMRDVVNALTHFFAFLYELNNALFSASLVWRFARLARKGIILNIFRHVLKRPNCRKELGGWKTKNSSYQ